jgi:hypothetical protein
VGGLLDSKGYGIATRPGTPFKPLLDQAILKLMEGGTLHRLRVKWWKQKRGGGACDAKVRFIRTKCVNFISAFQFFIVFARTLAAKIFILTVGIRAIYR